MHELLVIRLFKPAQEKVWLGELTIAVDLGRKATKQTNKTKEEASKKSLDGLNMFNGTNLTLSRDVDQDGMVSIHNTKLRIQSCNTPCHECE